jgi:uncharacterized protein with HEPN domain
MTRHEKVVILNQMRSYAIEAVNILEGKERSDLDQDRLINLALSRLLEIIGEAANRIPEVFQEEHPEIPWRQIISARNRLIHGYDNVDFDILWNIVKIDLPNLIKSLDVLLKNFHHY